MKVKITLAIVLMVSGSAMALAQTNRGIKHKHEDARRILNERLYLEKGYPLKSIHESNLSKNHISHLKADPVPINFTEKLDSMVAYGWEVDSMKWIPFTIDYYRYDALGRNYSYWYKEWENSLGKMVPYSRDDVKWNANRQLTERTEYQWNDTSIVWMPEFREIYNYDTNGSQILRLSRQWDIYGKKWYNYFVDSTYYTVSNKIWKTFEYRFDTLLKVWDPQYHVIDTYDRNDFRVNNATYTWVVDTTSRWEQNWETIYYNDDQGRDTLEVASYWDGFQWNQEFQYRTAYDANGNRILQEDIYWDGEMTDWYGSWRVESNYDGTDRLKTEIFYNWDRQSRDWFIYETTEYNYDGNGNLIEEIVSYYDTLLQVYIPKDRETWTYDLSVEMSEIAMPYWFGEEIMKGGKIFNHKVIGYVDMNWDTSKTQYDTVGFEFYYYSPLYESEVNESTCRANFSWILDEKDDLMAIFTHNSDKEVVSWYWMFGDGNSSTRQNPIHPYKEAGTYKVVLTTADKTGFCSNTVVKQIKVGSAPCNASFTHIIDTTKKEVMLINTSEGVNLRYNWDFGDGSYSRDKDPVHVYKFPGSYEIILTISDETDSCMDKYSAAVKAGDIQCDADFAVFIDSSTNIGYFRARNIIPQNQYYWILGDGSVSTIANHPHQFSHPGYYSVILTVSNDEAGCVDENKQTILVGTKSPGGKADFIYVAEGENKVKFTNRSLGTEISYLWDFNDTETSKEKDPLHEYALPGYYRVCLTVTNKDGSQNTYCNRIFAGKDTKDQCLAKFTYNLKDNGLIIRCFDRSFGNPDQWSWISSDGYASKDQHPFWTTSKPDYVKIHQTIRNSVSGCRDHAFALVNMGALSRLKAGFGYIIDSSRSKADTYPVDFVGISLGDAGKLKWDFGDGTSDSSTINPVHYYAEPGTYEVCLTITNSATGEQDKSCELISVNATSTRDLVLMDSKLIAYPNPFSESTRIEIRLTEDSEIDLAVYDLMGRKNRSVAQGHRRAGNHVFYFNGSKLEAGNYYLIMKTRNSIERTTLSIFR